MTKEIVNFGASKPSKNKLNCFTRQFGNIGKKNTDSVRDCKDKCITFQNL